MKKLFIPLLITMTGLAVNSALAQSTATITKPESSGFVTVDGGTPKELDAATLSSYLKICGAVENQDAINGWTIGDANPEIGRAHV